jgi:hypothetical protein
MPGHPANTFGMTSKYSNIGGLINVNELDSLLTKNLCQPSLVRGEGGNTHSEATATLFPEGSVASDRTEAPTTEVIRAVISAVPRL